MKAKNKIHQAKKAKWLTLIKEQSESSLTIKQWCDLNGYTIHTFYYWKRLLKEEALQNISVPEIVPLVQPPSPVLTKRVPTVELVQLAQVARVGNTFSK